MAGRARPASSISGSDPGAPARRAPSGFARIPRSTRRSAHASAMRSTRPSRAATRDWRGTPHGALARVLLLDQFTRNIFRDTPRAFAGDARGAGHRRATRSTRGSRPRGSTASSAGSCYMPFEHAEDVAAQRALARIVRRAGRGRHGDAAPLEWAQKHADVIFGASAAFRTATRSSAARRRPRRSRSCAAGLAVLSAGQPARNGRHGAHIELALALLLALAAIGALARWTRLPGPMLRDDRRRRRAVVRAGPRPACDLDPDVFFLLFIPPLLCRRRLAHSRSASSLKRAAAGAAARVRARSRARSSPSAT